MRSRPSLNSPAVSNIYHAAWLLVLTRAMVATNTFVNELRLVVFTSHVIHNWPTLAGRLCLHQCRD